MSEQSKGSQHPHDWWLHNVNLWRCAKCGGFVRSTTIPRPDANTTKGSTP